MAERSIDDGAVEGNVQCLVFARGLGTKVVGVVFELERQAFEGREVLDAAKERDSLARKKVAQVQGAAAADVGVAASKAVGQQGQGIVEQPLATDSVTPHHAEREVEVEVSLAGDDVFAVEEAGAQNVLGADRDLRKVGTFIKYQEFQVRAPIDGGDPRAQDPLAWLRAPGG